MKTELKRIVLAEDNPNDVELTLAALAEINLANEVVVLRDGAETLDYLFRRNAHAGRAPGNPALLLLDLKMPKVDGLEVLRELKAEDALKTIPVVVSKKSKPHASQGFTLTTLPFFQVMNGMFQRLCSAR